jgi:hypothetical protein
MLFWRCRGSALRNVSSEVSTCLRRASFVASLKQSFHSPSASELGARLSLAFGERAWSEAFTRLRRARCRVFESQAFTRLRRASHFLLLAQEKGNQREGHPGIRADRTASNRYPAVLAGHRPANNSAIPGLKQFAFPRCPAALLGAAAGDPRSTARLRRRATLRVSKDNSAPSPVALSRRSREFFRRAHRCAQGDEQPSAVENRFRRSPG